MKKILFGLLLFGSQISFAQTVLWSEDFSSGTETTSGTATGTPGGTWSVTTTPSGTFERQSPFGIDGFYINNTVTEGVWESNNFSIAETGMATISIELSTLFTSSSNYLRAYYKVDGGSEILFAELLGSFASLTTTGSAIVSGANLQIVVRGIETTAGDLSLFRFNNVVATSVLVVYSRKNGTWTDVTAGNGTWSTVSLGGVSCDCTPTAGQVAIIGNGNTVTLPSSQSVGGVDIKSTGIFQYNTSASTLSILMGLFRVESGGTVNSSGAGITGEQIIFDADVGGANLQIDAGGTVSIEDLVLSTAATNLHYISGDGSLTITDDILINADNASLTNNLTTSLPVGDDIIFNCDNSDLTNTGTLTFGGDIAANDTSDDGNEFINSTGATLSFVNMDALATGSGNGAFLSILNSGTINQSGTFTDIQNSTNAGNDINNLNGAVWNYAGTGHDTDLRLFANNGTNNFNYSLGGAQQIITPVTGDGYSNISLQTSGAKTALANFNVYGNWSRTGTATFAPAGFTVTFSGTGAQIISAVGGETFSSLTFNNSFATSPQITLSNSVVVTGTLTMTDGNVNLNGSSFTLGTSAASTGTLSHAGSSANGWLYGGSLIRFMAVSNATTIGGGDQNEGFFPLGSATDFRPFFVGKNNNANTGGSITVTHNDASSTSTVNIPDTAPVATITRRHDSNWSATTTGITGGTWDLRAGGTNFGTIQEVADIRLSTSAGVVGTNSAAIGGPTDWRANRTGLTFGELTNTFHLASTDATNSPLPVTLVYFKVGVIEGRVKLEWKTAQEINNDFFTIEKTTGLETFQQVAILDGQGTTNEANYYSAFDESPSQGRSYYRLKQTDFDGKFTYSAVKTIDYSGPEFAFLRVYPNPSQGQKITIEILGLKETKLVPVQIINMHGQKIWEKTFEVKTPGTLKEDLILDASLSSGLYIIKAGSTVLLTQKIVVE